MTKRPTGKMTKLRQGTQELLERRGMKTGVGGKPRAFGPVLHTGLRTNEPAAFGTYSALAGESAFSHGGRRMASGAAKQGVPPAHTELKGHRHRGAEQHSSSHSSH